MAQLRQIDKNNPRKKHYPLYLKWKVAFFSLLIVYILTIIYFNKL